MICEGDAQIGFSYTVSDMTAEIDLALPARAENIAIVRHAFGALGEAYDVSEQRLSDIRLAVTEACTNVVVHAYPDAEEGPLEVEAKLSGEDLVVVVRDRGKGIAPRPDSPGLGLGLPLIASLADSVKLGHDENGHTEVRMGFSLAERGEELAGAPS
jgi:anti-sigma regulatory factor (Ser/Thr protein kinase)